MASKNNNNPTLSETLSIYSRAREPRTAVYRTSFTDSQAPFKTSRPAKGPKLVSRITIPGDTSGIVKEIVEEAIRGLGNGKEVYDEQESVEIDGEWVSRRRGVGEREAEPQGSEEERFRLMEGECESQVVMLYVHGGAGYIGSAAASRNLVSKLCGLTAAKCLSINYRLAPQCPFPGPLMDVLLAYLYLLYPPPGAYHKPVPAEKIVFIADSFGAYLAMSLLQTLLFFNASSSTSTSTSATKPRTISYQGQHVPLPTPAGLALVSPYSYGAATSYPSMKHNAQTDVFPVPLQAKIFYTHPSFPSCTLWSTNPPPRGDMFCTTSLLSHPLVSPAVATSWHGSPPIYMASGQECIIDSVSGIAQLAARQGVSVVWEEYEAMCHVWMTNFPNWKQSLLLYERWAEFILKAGAEGEEVVGKGCFIEFDGLRERGCDVGNMKAFSREESVRLLERETEERARWEEDMREKARKSARL